MPKGEIYNRDSFLANIRVKVGGISPEIPVEKPNWSVSPQRNVLRGASQDELVQLLSDQCTQIHTDFFITTVDDLPSKLIEVFGFYEAESIVYSDDSRFSDYGIEQYLIEKKAFKWDNESREKSIEQSEKADIGITFSDITLAESGTVVLLNNPGQGRSVSLLPEKYIAIIPKSSIVKRMTQATDIINQQVKNNETIASSVNFITGPSNSADIEMNLVVGVHGPVRAAYIVIEDR
ncbi:L-lactate dehydrogenase complex protein LldG [Gracilibacillus halotolerans]|uniref:L-lactate dehydrogenase complex protein LldG n=1 Tax=Gracilibacillus halotolerans TaxID=74386 RepID=A0A841RK57_9BACI|nr:lactate utilization protein C [Gracilibacillus halotolerans]MBB6511575.1 L-lactate dehydrogenase complex protein LldG [Gracilibacillus halotolerans]